MKWGRRIFWFYAKQARAWVRGLREGRKPTTEAQRFIEANAAFWAGVEEGAPGDGSSGYLLVRLERHTLIEMINRLGSDVFAARKCRTLEDIKKYPLKMEPQYAELIFGAKRKALLALADEYLERRFGQQLNHPALDVAFGSEV